MADERSLTGEWEETPTGPGMRVCGLHQSHAVALALLEQRQERLDEEQREMCDQNRREHAEFMRALDTIRQALEAVKVSTAMDKAKLGIVLAVAASVGAAAMSHIGKLIGG